MKRILNRKNGNDEKNRNDILRHHRVLPILLMIPILPIDLSMSPTPSCNHGNPLKTRVVERSGFEPLILFRNT